jgi:hypothetical protein
MSFTFVTQLVINFYCVSFSCKGKEFRFVGIKFHMVSSTPVCVLNQCHFVDMCSHRAQGTKNFDIISSRRYLECLIELKRSSPSSSSSSAAAAAAVVVVQLGPVYVLTRESSGQLQR